MGVVKPSLENAGAKVKPQAKAGEDRKRYNRIAAIYEIAETPMELFLFKKWRENLFERINSCESDLILEIGVGTGKNVPYYRDGCYIAVDISEKMIFRAKRRVKDSKKVQFIVGDAESLPFKDGIFDIVFTTFVFCSVENPVKGLKEAYRVLKPDGRAFFLEHMLPENRLIQPFFHLLNPIARMMGPEINRKTDENIRRAGFSIVEEEHLLGTVFRLIEAVKSK